MTAHLVPRIPSMTWRERVRAAIERMLPWFDPAAERVRDAHTEEIRQQSIAARMHTERVRRAYRQYADKAER
jgi:hypothetical protein